VILRHRKISLFLLGLAGVLFMVALTFKVPKATATPLQQESTPTPQAGPTASSNTQESIGNDVCLSCHGKPGLEMALGNGDKLGLYVSPDEYAHSIHGQKDYACAQCHTTVGNYPHPPFSATDVRDVNLKLIKVCQRCHTDEYERAQDSVHGAALASGNRNAAVCTDCHTAHSVRQLTDPKTGNLLPDARVWIPQTCSKCHNEIYQKYLTSVHGSALIDQGNPDVPTCIDCHGVHNIQNPTTNTFRLKSPQICAGCHTDPKRMAKYGISTQVLNTYVADFHGTTVELFQKQSPDAPTNKPVCFDCHGVHDIKRIDDPKEGLSIRENLLARCRVCHPDANANFPDAWLSHYIPSPDKTPLVYYVNLFYKFFIPGILGGMAILVVMDIGKNFATRMRKKPIPEIEPFIQMPAPPLEMVPSQGEQAPVEASPELTISEITAPGAEISAEEPVQTPEETRFEEFPEKAIEISEQALEAEITSKPIEESTQAPLPELTEEATEGQIPAIEEEPPSMPPVETPTESPQEPETNEGDQEAIDKKSPTIGSDTPPDTPQSDNSEEEVTNG